ncbi:MAG TPA: nuclear transport factor 2 family protein [Gemmatimonadaceae bacterium]|nr:nuclear transport factor 2 family protein [Gemmatimonadaceae bacterium]
MESRGAALFTVGVFLLSGCNKPTPATADSAGLPGATTSSTAAGTFDENLARAQILGADSAFLRAMASKHVDSLMVYYDPNVVSLGKAPVKGTSDLRKYYDNAVNANARDASFQSDGVNFSADHSMAWDYGTFSQTSDGPNGKPVKSSGTFLNVWKNVDGRWKIVAEISCS